MKKSVILIRKDYFIHDGKEYEFDKLRHMNNFFYPNMKIVIIEEELFVKQFSDMGKKNRIREFVDLKINNEFPQNGDILYDFKMKNNNLIIYSIRGAKRVESLAETSKSIEVKPIQFIVKDSMKKYLKNNTFTCRVLVKFYEHYYYMSFKEGLFSNGIISEGNDIDLNNDFRTEDLGDVYIDNQIDNINIDHKDKFKVIKMNIGELISEEIYEKQRFYSRKIL
jgi:hypothetical protein